MSKRKHSKEFKLRLLKEPAENGISFYQLEKDNNLFWDGKTLVCSIQSLWRSWTNLQQQHALQILC